jgi:hypothetical protein
MISQVKAIMAHFTAPFGGGEENLEKSCFRRVRCRNANPCNTTLHFYTLVYAKEEEEEEEAESY